MKGNNRSLVTLLIQGQAIEIQVCISSRLVTMKYFIEKHMTVLDLITRPQNGSGDTK